MTFQYKENEFGQVEGTAFFPYFNKEITVICREDVSSEYVEHCREYLETVDETLILQICKYAEFFLKDMVENTSIADIGDEFPWPYDNLLGLLQYFGFECLYIDSPPESIAAPFKINVLNLSGYCDWWEDEGLQCLIKDGEVVYLGYFDGMNIWNDQFYSGEHYIGNYVLYERWDELRKKAAERIAQRDPWRTERSARWYRKGLPTTKLEHFSDDILASEENVDVKEATEILENSYLFELMNEYPKLLEESMDFWYECYRIEKEQDIGELVRYISENCEWDMF